MNSLEKRIVQTSESGKTVGVPALVSLTQDARLFILFQYYFWT
jgi:hypothetical protein